MSDENLFEVASRKKFLFDSPTGGKLDVNDLWDIPLTGARSLNEVAKIISRQLKEVAEENFVDTAASRGATNLEQKLELCKHIIKVRLEEDSQRKAASERRQTKERIKEIIEQKQDEALRGKSMEELSALMNTL